MYDDEIEALRDWLNSEEHVFSYSHTEEEDGEDVLFVSVYDYEEFCNWLTENATDLIYIPGKIGNDGVWFSSVELSKARFY